ncbi:MAG: AIR carboxylase family protein [Negativicoccus succinicivorans]|nr:AIR carboxylase family protein [Negativicoccus succinicivorans]
MGEYLHTLAPQAKWDEIGRVFAYGHCSHQTIRSFVAVVTEELKDAQVCIAIAGIEGALPTVISGLIPAPVIGVPTSVGYGVAQNGMTALFGMLTSCADKVAVVNIDNGYGAARVAAAICREKDPS